VIREACDRDYAMMNAIINESALAYQGIIPADRWHEPYMPMAEMLAEIDKGVRFHVLEEGGEIVGVMGIQDKGDVVLIRHAYVRTAQRGKGYGSRLLGQLCADIQKPILIGTWAAATWAISFYRKHGFTLVDEQTKDALLHKYWDIPERQVETSVVLIGKGKRCM
jgi:N-acetylglutamate synthase-like GNAT family acetyltransferase